MQGLEVATFRKPSRHCSRFLRLLAALGVLLAFGLNQTAAQAVRLARPGPRPQLSAFGSISVSASPTAVSFNLVSGGTASGSSSITITTSYTNGIGIASTVKLYGYFSSAASALTGSGSSIPSSDVYGIVPGGGAATSYTAFTQTTPFSGASGLELTTETAALTGNGNFSGTLSLQIRLAATPQLPAATYTGTLTLEAQAN